MNEAEAAEIMEIIEDDGADDAPAMGPELPPQRQLELQRAVIADRGREGNKECLHGNVFAGIDFPPLSQSMDTDITMEDAMVFQSCHPFHITHCEICGSPHQTSGRCCSDACYRRWELKNREKKDCYYVKGFGATPLFDGQKCFRF